MIATAEGAWVTDVDGRRYLDMLAAYSAINFGHRHPRLVAAAQRQLERVTLVSRAFEHDQFGPFCAELAALAGMEMVLPMNTGAEAVETAIKTARKWGYEVKGVPDGEAVIVVFDGNFHGRTTTIISFSTDPDARDGYGPYTPGFRIVPYGDLDALAAAMDDNVVAVLAEPIQGEAGRAGAAARLPGRACASSAPRTARCSSPTRSSPASAAPARRSPASTRTSCRTCTSWARRWAAASCRSRPWCPPATVLGVFKPGQHGSTFGGNPLACAVAREVIAMLSTGEFQERSAKLGAHMLDRLNALPESRCARCAAAACGRAWSSPSLTGPRRLRAAGRARRAGQGHPRLHDPAGPAAGHRRGGPGLGPRPGRGARPLRSGRAALPAARPESVLAQPQY